MVTARIDQEILLCIKSTPPPWRSRQRCAKPAPRNRAVFSRETIVPKSDQSIEELCENGRLPFESCSVVSRIHPGPRRTNSTRSMHGCFELLRLSECRLWHRELSQLPPLDSTPQPGNRPVRATGRKEPEFLANRSSHNQARRNGRRQCLLADDKAKFHRRRRTDLNATSLSQSYSDSTSNDPVRLGEEDFPRNRFVQIAARHLTTSGLAKHAYAVDLPRGVPLTRTPDGLLPGKVLL